MASKMSAQFQKGIPHLTSPEAEGVLKDLSDQDRLIAKSVVEKTNREAMKSAQEIKDLGAINEIYKKFRR